MKPKYFLYLLVPLTIFEAYAEYAHWPEGKFFSKPLLMPLIGSVVNRVRAVEKSVLLGHDRRQKTI
jgi:hypothetical protein